ncbi:hypothetical protein [Streptomyces sp. ISL-100]|uniref:hypothetical protein n=1 Tax=Streptomyces sp. ISL-100 TaxID=2819173 RepID=UPI001BEB457F|nr:hypothetical protein [Streptomyces sp. ISL-100]MBT2400627.1 hypothetical protein [Streptomyces sp. ISL-100]
MSEAQDLVLRLRAAGMSNRAIGREIGRNDRLIKYVADGDKPGNNLVESLRALAAKRGGDTAATVPQAPRRKTAKGATAKVRRKSRWAAGRTVKVKAQAVKSGAKAVMARLHQAAIDGDRVAFTLTFDKRAQLTMSDGTPIPPDGKEQTAEIGNKGSGFPAAYVEQKCAGDLVGWLVRYLMDANRLQAPAMPIGLEIRVWNPDPKQTARDAEDGLQVSEDNDAGTDQS